MGKVIIEESSLEDIADSIRAKNGSNSLYKPGEMSGAIDDIEGVSDYFGGTITGSSTASNTWSVAIKKLPLLANTGTTCQNLFYGFKGIELDLSLIDTTNVTTMTDMFSSCINITSLNLSNFNTSLVTNMAAMFDGCSSLTSLNLSNFNTSLVTNMSYMFHNCSSLTNLDLSNFNTSLVTNMAYMFSGCSSLTSLDLSSFTFKPNTGVSIGYMFSVCKKLIHLDIRGMDFTYITSYSSMFGNSSNHVPYTCEIIVKDNDAKAWLNEKFPNYTNVKTVAEYEVNE